MNATESDFGTSIQFPAQIALPISHPLCPYTVTRTVPLFVERSCFYMRCVRLKKFVKIDRSAIIVIVLVMSYMVTDCVCLRNVMRGICDYTLGMITVTLLYIC